MLVTVGADPSVSVNVPAPWKVAIFVDAMERCANRRPQVGQLVSAWNQNLRGNAELAGEPDDPLIGTSMEPRKRPRTRLTIDEVGAIRTARANGASVAALATQFGIHRGTVWAKSRT